MSMLTYRIKMGTNPSKQKTEYYKVIVQVLVKIGKHAKCIGMYDTMVYYDSFSKFSVNEISLVTYKLSCSSVSTYCFSLTAMQVTANVSTNTAIATMQKTLICESPIQGKYFTKSMKPTK